MLERLLRVKAAQQALLLVPPEGSASQVRRQAGRRAAWAGGCRAAAPRFRRVRPCTPPPLAALAGGALGSCVRPMLRSWLHPPTTTACHAVLMLCHAVCSPRMSATRKGGSSDTLMWQTAGGGCSPALVPALQQLVPACLLGSCLFTGQLAAGWLADSVAMPSCPSLISAPQYKLLISVGRPQPVGTAPQLGSRPCNAMQARGESGRPGGTRRGAGSRQGGGNGGACGTHGAAREGHPAVQGRGAAADGLSGTGAAPGLGHWLLARHTAAHAD